MTSRPRASRPTIYDVAREAGVSKSLVSLVLNDSELVSEVKREAVKRAIAQLGYRPSRAAANLAMDRTYTVGLVIDDFSNPWYIELLQGIRTVMGPHGFHVAIQEHYREGDALVNAIDGFLDAQVDALVVAAEPGRDFGPLGIPTVIEDHRLHTIEDADHVTSDQSIGVELVLHHLRTLGHRRIGHVSGVGGSAKARLRAYLEVMQSFGEPARYTGERNETNEEGGYIGTVELLRRYPEITAVFAVNDTMALGARAALREVGREVPHDVALVGYDNSLLARSRFLDLTTVDQRGFDVGVASSEAILRRLADPGIPPVQTVIPPRLVIRSSSVSAPSTSDAGR